MTKPIILNMFDGYEVHGCKDFFDRTGAFTEQVPDEEAEFWSVYGHYSPESGEHGVECISDHETKEEAVTEMNKLKEEK